MMICLTYNKYLKKQKVPVQAVCNELHFPCIPEIWSSLNKLERVLIARRILFKKVRIMPKGRFAKLKGSICNIHIDVANIAIVFPCGAESNCLIVVKLKRKLTLKRLGVNLTPTPFGFSKSVFSRERVKPWFFVAFNIIKDHIFPENFIEIRQVVQKIWRFSPSIFTILINFSDFPTFPYYKETNDVNILQMMSALFYFSTYSK